MLTIYSKYLRSMKSHTSLHFSPLYFRSVVRTTSVMSPILFYNWTIASSPIPSFASEEQSLEFNRTGRKDVAKFCTCAGGEYLQCICVCVCLKNFHGIIFSFISKGYPTKIMILYLNLWVIKNIIFVKFNQTCVEILEILKQNSNKK